MAHLPASKDHSKLCLVSPCKKPLEMMKFYLIVMLFYIRFYLYFFQVDSFLVFARLFFFFLLFIFIFRVIHYPANRRRRLACNLNQVKPGFFCLLQCILGIYN